MVVRTLRNLWRSLRTLVVSILHPQYLYIHLEHLFETHDSTAPLIKFSRAGVASKATDAHLKQRGSLPLETARYTRYQDSAWQALGLEKYGCQPALLRKDCERKTLNGSDTSALASVRACAHAKLSVSEAPDAKKRLDRMSVSLAEIATLLEIKVSTRRKDSKRLILQIRGPEMQEGVPNQSAQTCMPMNVCYGLPNPLPGETQGNGNKDKRQGTRPPGGRTHSSISVLTPRGMDGTGEAGPR
ncbi:hypothetical protein LZ30DRAFT_722767 [Colletotrichum cereale]|nr:hypothetical protein LZ30DRAFT_722767 [Colletotrichum cereale]